MRDTDFRKNTPLKKSKMGQDITSAQGGISAEAFDKLNQANFGEETYQVGHNGHRNNPVAASGNFVDSSRYYTDAPTYAEAELASAPVVKKVGGSTKGVNALKKLTEHHANTRTNSDTDIYAKWLLNPKFQKVALELDRLRNEKVLSSTERVKKMTLEVTMKSILTDLTRALRSE